MAPMHFAVGIAGLLAWRNVWSPLTYAQVLGGFYGLLTVLGLIPGGEHDVPACANLCARCVAPCLQRRARHLLGLAVSPA